MEPDGSTSGSGSAAEAGSEDEHGGLASGPGARAYRFATRSDRSSTSEIHV